jgi:cytoskeletal protein CcmA (bactofilin family)
MKPIVKLASLILLAVLVFVPLQPAAAKGLMDGQVIFGQSYTLKSGETLEGDLVVFGGSAVIEAGAVVNGSVILFGGNLTVNGEVTVDAAIVGGSITLGAASHIHGNLSTVGSMIDRLEGSQVDGQITNAATSWTTDGENGAPIVPPETQPVAPRPNVNVNFHPLTSILNAFWQAIGWGVLAMLVMFFLSTHAGRVAGTVMSQPVTAGGLGLLTVIAAPITVVLLSVTILLIPVAVVAVIALVVAVSFGWIAIGYEVGMRFTKAIHQEWHPALSAGLGTFVLSLVATALAGIPVLNCIGWFIPFLLGVAGLGAVIMTRFGTQAVTAPAKKAAVVPTDPSGQNPA